MEASGKSLLCIQSLNNPATARSFILLCLPLWHLSAATCISRAAPHIPRNQSRYPCNPRENRWRGRSEDLPRAIRTPRPVAVSSRPAAHHRHISCLRCYRLHNWWAYSLWMLQADCIVFVGLDVATHYRYAPHNDVSVNDGPHIRRWSHKIII